MLGGYCRIIGMTNLEEVAPEDEERAYRSKGYLARVVVAGAGPAVHFVIAFVLMFSLLFVAGDLQPRARAHEARRGVARCAGRPACKAGDTLVSIDGTRVTKWEQVAGLIQHHQAGDRVRDRRRPRRRARHQGRHARRSTCTTARRPSCSRASPRRSSCRTRRSSSRSRSRPAGSCRSRTRRSTRSARSSRRRA